MPINIREKNEKKLTIALYVDDGLVAPNNQQECEIFIEKLKARFKKVNGNASSFLGFKIEYNKNGDITISEKEYAKKILKRFENCKPVTSPMLKESRSQNTGESKKVAFLYRQAAEALMYGREKKINTPC